MRPRSAETSEPACVKRKMLSMNSSTSFFSASRKYSATVRPLSATRRRAPSSAQERRDFRARLRETEDVVDEQQHVLFLGVAEVLGHGQAAERDAQARAELGPGAPRLPSPPA